MRFVIDASFSESVLDDAGRVELGCLNGNFYPHQTLEPASRPNEITLFEVDARAGFEKPARIINTTIKRGIEGLQQEVQLAAATPARLLSAFRQNAIGNTWQTIEDVQWRYDVKAQASIQAAASTHPAD